MQKNEYDIDLLVTDFANGTISHEDFKILESWTFDNDENRAYVRKLMEIAFTTGTISNRNLFDSNKAIERFHNRIKNEKTPVYTPTAHKPHVWRLTRYAAAIAVLVIMTWWGYKTANDNIFNRFTNIVAEAPYGSQLTLTLPDGSKIRLNSGSRIEYSQGFGITDRNVTIDGEGFFEVAHNSDIQFVVKSPELEVVDIGTEFVFRNYHDDNAAYIELVAGEIELRNNIKDTAAVRMKPGECMVMNKQNGSLSHVYKETPETQNDMFNNITFENERIEDIARVLCRYYGVNITVEPDAGNRRFYGSFNRKDDTIEKILKMISSTQQIKYRKENNRYVIY